MYFLLATRRMVDPGASLCDVIIHRFHPQYELLYYYFIILIVDSVGLDGVVCVIMTKKVRHHTCRDTYNLIPNASRIMGEQARVLWSKNVMNISNANGLCLFSLFSFLHEVHGISLTMHDLVLFYHPNFRLRDY